MCFNLEEVILYIYLVTVSGGRAVQQGIPCFSNNRESAFRSAYLNILLLPILLFTGAVALTPGYHTIICVFLLPRS